jgi:FtsP/CotA-like multicopper oxidase with cupredoxin domain
MAKNSLLSWILLIACVCAQIFLLFKPPYLQGARAAHRSRVRTYYVAADEVDWDYAPDGRNDAMDRPFDDLEKNYMDRGPHKIGRVYKKAVYHEYTDGRFAKLKPRSAEEQYLGILGPILRAEVGDTIKVFFKNRASRPYSMHPHGMLYQKGSEGSGYNDGTTGQDKADDTVPPGATQVYVWEVPERAGPAAGDGSSVVWLYHSHVDEMKDIASGLFGAIIVTGSGKARNDGTPYDVDHEFLTMLITINENESWYLGENIQRFTSDPKGVNRGELIAPSLVVETTGILGRGFADANLRNTINGYMFGAMPMMTMKKGERVRWYLVTLGDVNNFHTPHWHGNDVMHMGHRTDVVALAPGQMEIADMIPDNPGIWLYHCHVSDHMASGMMTRYEVKP